MGLLKQTWTLTTKNILIALNRHLFPTAVRAFLLPVFFIAFVTFARNLFVSPSVFGVGTSHLLRNLPDGMAAASGGRDNLVLINSGFAGGDIDKVISIVAAQALSAGKNVTKLTNSSDLVNTCRSTIRGVTKCYAAVEFESSPSEGVGGAWNYSLRADGALGRSIFVDQDSNDGEVYLLPLQRAVDYAIASISPSVDQSALPSGIQSYAFTSITQSERAKEIRVAYQSTIIDALGGAVLLGMVGVVYHLVGFIATERELGMSQLVEAMMPNLKRWQPQVARIVAYHVSFSIIYIPGWVVLSLILGFGLFVKTSKVIVVIYHILAGLSFTSWAIFGASFFKKAQLSGITVTIFTLVLTIIAQAFDVDISSGAVAVLSLLFVPCNYVYFLVVVARWEQQEYRTDLLHGAPNNWSLPGIVFWIFLIVQIFAYPLLGALVEKWLHGTGSKGRTVVRGLINAGENPATKNTVELQGFSKHYPPTLLHRIFRPKTSGTVIAVENLSLTASKGQIFVLLGANGSGKSTTLDSIAGMNTVTSGTITVDGTGGLGICPQKNVLWPELTVEEHVRIFNKLKAPGKYETKEALHAMIKSIDLDRKINSKAKTLSGGQKRKLQLGMMLTGGSAVCCVDEVSSGLDPISRRKIWDILLSERGSRTIILTTHFLDEADLLADHIAILSRGTLRAEGSSVELKNRLGGGYRVHIPTGPGHREAPHVEGVSQQAQFDQTSYFAASSSQAALVVRTLQQQGIEDYQLSGPTIEDVFLQLAEEIHGDDSSTGVKSSPENSIVHVAEEKRPEAIIARALDRATELELLSGRPIGFFRQAWVLFRKRLTLLRRNYLPYGAAFFIPIICAILVTRLVHDQTTPTCAPNTPTTAKFQTISNQYAYNLAIGPSSRVTLSNSPNAAALYLADKFKGLPSTDVLSLIYKNTSIVLVDSTADFNNFVTTTYSNITPAAYYFGDSSSLPTFAYMADYSPIYTGIFAQNMLNQGFTNMTIFTRYRAFETPWIPGTGASLQLIVYFGLVMAAVSGFYSLYPTLERLRHVRGLEYSNGVRPLPLWLAYTTFDFIVFLLSSVVVVIIFAVLSKVWYHVIYMFPVIFLFGLASILQSYIISLFAKGQLAAFAFTAGSQAIFFLVYIIAYLSTLTYVPVVKVDKALLIVHFTVSLITPMGSLIRALFVSMNLFSTSCDGSSLASKPMGMTLYGGPILYLLLQSIVFFCIILWHDGGSLIARYRGARQVLPELEANETIDEETAHELEKVTREANGLRVLHLTKSFGKLTAVEDLTFGIERGEVFALLGPNGAGKSTTISLIRGDIQPSRNGGNIYVDDILISKHRAQARSHLGVCPQFDAMDQLTVVEHLEFYARVRGVTEVSHNVRAVLRAVGLEAFSTRMAFKLSGGNRRKLSLGIALMGNPSVVLLDEPSSGMDAAAKRVMWKTLSGVVAGRAILLTTHSMEEAGALASRAGIMSKRMLALGTTDYLRRKHGDAFYIHLVTKTAPHTSEEEMAALRNWVTTQFPRAEIEEKTYHGQLRFSVPADELPAAVRGRTRVARGDEIEGGSPALGTSAGGIGALITLLEDKKEELGLDHYSVSPTTLDQVFLSIVAQHNVEEENYSTPKARTCCGMLGG